MYVGIQQQIRKNNRNSFLLLLLFPLLLLTVVFVVTRTAALAALAFTGCVIWFVIAYFINDKLIELATGSRPLERRDNPRVYNLLENLCISQGMSMPKIRIIEDDSLNAFASGLRTSTYCITVSRGMLDKLNDEELEGVLAHELSHIINRDVRLLVISIIFVGIFSFIAEMTFRSIRFSGSRSRSSNNNNALILLIAVVVTAIGYFISILLRFGISRNREYLADATAAEITKRPYALASALRKVSEDPCIEAVESRDVAQLFMHNPKPSSLRHSWDNLFSTHPPIQKRIELLEQYV